MIRSPEQARAFAEAGVTPVPGDLEQEFTSCFLNVDAVVFTAGSGGATGGDKTLLVDLWGAVRTFRACEAAGIKRYVMISALRARNPDVGPEKLRHYLVAKHVADDYLRRTALDYTILRPSRLTNGPATHQVTTCYRDGDPVGTVSRADVALFTAQTLFAPQTIRQTIDLSSGNTPILDAITKHKKSGRPTAKHTASPPLDRQR